MTFGINILSSSGSRQISDLYSNYTLLSSGTLNIAVPSAVNDPNTYTALSYTNTGVVPLVFARVISGGPYIAVVRISASEMRIKLSTGSAPNAGVSGTIEYKVFAPQSLVTPQNGFGIRVFNGSGQPVFNSLNGPLPIANVCNVTTQTQTAFPGGLNNGTVSSFVHAGGGGSLPFFNINNIGISPLRIPVSQIPPISYVFSPGLRADISTVYVTSELTYITGQFAAWGQAVQIPIFILKG